MGDISGVDGVRKSRRCTLCKVQRFVISESIAS